LGLISKRIATLVLMGRSIDDAGESIETAQAERVKNPVGVGETYRVRREEIR
jgi:hypothetical protein